MFDVSTIHTINQHHELKSVTEGIINFVSMVEIKNL